MDHRLLHKDYLVEFQVWMLMCPRIILLVFLALPYFRISKLPAVHAEFNPLVATEDVSTFKALELKQTDPRRIQNVGLFDAMGTLSTKHTNIFLHTNQI